MLVDVVEMYRRDQRLERQSLKSVPPCRGMLRLAPGRPGRDPRDRNPPLLAGLARPEGAFGWVMPPLDRAWVYRINERGMLIRGRQEHQPIRSNRSSEWFDQAWWVRVVGTPVDAVVEMYRRGQPLERAGLKLVQPLRGVLSLTPDRPGRDPRDRNPPLLAGLAGFEGCSWVFPPLDKAWVARIHARGMLIKGRQELQSTRSSRSSDWFNQAWWVRQDAPPASAAAIEFEDVQSVHLAD